MKQRRKVRRRNHFQQITLHFFLFIVFMCNFSSNANCEDLCYLSNGGSSETFTVNEAAPINSVIGTLQVIGNVSKLNGDGNDGNIELSLSTEQQGYTQRIDEQDIPIKLEPGSKDIILTRKLDRESIEGEHGIVVGIKCRKLDQKADPSIIIPVRIIVTDANDHAPEFIGAPYVVNISEVTLVGSSLFPHGKIRAVDNDQQGPFSTVEYYVEPGPFSHMVKFENQLSSNLIITSPLDYETLPVFRVNIRSQDQGEPPNTSVTSVTVNVIDADDQNPRFLDDKYVGKLQESNRENDALIISPRSIRAADPDKGISSPIEYSFNSPPDTREYSFFKIDPKFADITLKKPLPLSISLPLTLVIRATQVDNKDRYALTTLTIFSRKQLNLSEIRIIQSNYAASVLENLPPGHVVLTIQTTRADSSLHRENAIQFQILDDDEGFFGIRQNGEVILKKSLDYESKPWYSFRVMVSDGKQSDVARVNVTVLNVNDHDPVFGQAHYNFFVSEASIRKSAIVGEVKASDKDTGDKVSLSIKGPFAKIFIINDEGLIKLKSLKNLNTSQCHLIVEATDNGLPPRSSSVPVTVQFGYGALKSISKNIDDLDGYLSKTSVDGKNIDHNLSGVDMSVIFSASNTSAIILVIVLGVLLATLFIIIITLTVHVLKQRKFSENSVSAGSSSSSDSSDNATTNPLSFTQSALSSRRTSSIPSLRKTNRIMPSLSCIQDNRNLFTHSAPGLRGVENPIFNMPNTLASNLVTRYYSSPPNSTSNRSDPDSAIVSDESSNGKPCRNEIINENENNESNGLVQNETDDNDKLVSNENIDHNILNTINNNNNNNNNNSTMCDSPPPPPPSITGMNGHGTISGSTGSSRITVIKWPQGSIPRRVKKLTWEDERFTRAKRIDEINFYENNRKDEITLNQTYTQPETELDPDVSVTPLRRTYHNHHHHLHHHHSQVNDRGTEPGVPDLTVYF